MTNKKSKYWKFENKKRRWLNPDPARRAFISWDIAGREHEKSSNLDIILSIADCSRTIYLDFGFSDFGDQRTKAAALKKVRLFRGLINEFCNQAEMAVEARAEVDKRVKKREKNKGKK